VLIERSSTRLRSSQSSLNPSCVTSVGGQKTTPRATLVPVEKLLKGPETRLVRFPSISGDRIAFTYFGSIWTANADGSNARRLTIHPGRDTYPTFSPDGKRIAFSSMKNGSNGVFIIPCEGGEPKQLTFDSAYNTVLGWTPDSRSVLYSSEGQGFRPKLFTVGIDGSLPKDVGADAGVWGSFSPDGSKIAFNRSSQYYFRRGYRGADQSDVFVMDLATRRTQQLTQFEGMDSWPMWAADGKIYFVSDREPDGIPNLWSIDPQGGDPERVTAFDAGTILFPKISADGRTIVFERDFHLMTLDVATRSVQSVDVSLRAEPKDVDRTITYDSKVDAYALSPSARNIAFTARGRLFLAPVSGGSLRLLAEGGRAKQPQYSPDGAYVAFVWDASGTEQVYVARSDGSSEPRALTESDDLKYEISWSPDSKRIAIADSTRTLSVVDLETGHCEAVASAPMFVSDIAWSADGRMLAYSKVERFNEASVFVNELSAGVEHRISTAGLLDTAPTFSADGGSLYFKRAPDASPDAIAQIACVALRPALRDPEADAVPDEPNRLSTVTADFRRPPFDWTALDERVRVLTSFPLGVSSYAVTASKLLTVTREVGASPSSAIYASGVLGKGAARLVAAQGSNAIDSLAVSSDGSTLTFREGGSVFAAPVAGGGAKTQVQFKAKVKLDQRAEWSQMFDEVWRTLKHRYYDPTMHGKNWDALRAKYRPQLEHVGDRKELLNVINEMIGELNTSHVYVYAPADPSDSSASTMHLGFDLTDDREGGRYRVSHIYAGGPADNGWVKVRPGDYLIAIDGKEVRLGDNYQRLLSDRLNASAEVTLNDRPGADGAWKTTIKTASPGDIANLRYQRWVDERKAIVQDLSNGRVGYIHVPAMMPPQLAPFREQLRAMRSKEAVIIDIRYNTGGNIEQDVLATLEQRPLNIQRLRGATEATVRPYSGFFGPKVLLQNEKSFSNAEMMAAGFRELGLGKIVGTKTGGGVIWTWADTLIDGSILRRSSAGAFLVGEPPRDLENMGIPPDVLVENSPDDEVQGKDRQLEVAVREALDQLTGRLFAPVRPA
jgi:tricorn protease